MNHPFKHARQKIGKIERNVGIYVRTEKFTVYWF